MDFIKKAIENHIPQFLREGDEGKPWKSEPDLYKRDMMRLTHYCVESENENIPTSVQALAEIGNISYIGGADTIKTVLPQFMPYLLGLIQDPDTPGPLKTQALRTLSMVAHRNRAVQEYVCKDSSALEGILDVINDVTRVQDSRWACYALLMLINDNAQGLKIIKDMEQTKEVLERAADLGLPWLIWGSNHADTLLKQLGLRHYNQQDEPRDRNKRKQTRVMVEPLPTGVEDRPQSIFERLANTFNLRRFSEE